MVDGRQLWQIHRWVELGSGAVDGRQLKDSIFLSWFFRTSCHQLIINERPLHFPPALSAAGLLAEHLVSDTYTPARTNPVQVDEGDRWEVKLEKGKGAVLTFEFREQIVGFPYFTITAPAGTAIELMVREGHATGKGIVMNNHFHAWTRFTCREGENRFETFDYLRNFRESDCHAV